jgi:cell division protein FtsI (penicillin-binding protein 3)
MKNYKNLFFKFRLSLINGYIKIKRLLYHLKSNIIRLYNYFREINPYLIKASLMRFSLLVLSYTRAIYDILSDTTWRLSKTNLKSRLYLVLSSFLAIYLGLSLQLFSMTLKYRGNHGLLAIKSTSQATPPRKEIVDKNGYILASNLNTASLYANPKLVWDAGEAAEGLLEILPELDEEKLKAKLSNTRKSFCWIKRNLTPKEQAKIHNLGLPGLFFEEESKRVYTYGKLLSHVLGYVDIDGIGRAGIEKYYEDFLNPRPAAPAESGDLLTRLISSSNDLDEQTAEDKLKLSVDIKAQNILYEELNAAKEEFQALGATGVIADTATGEIVAMSSLPEFDPHNPGEASQNEIFNRATLGSYELGSIMKVLTMAIGLDSKSISLRDAYNLDKQMTISGFTIKDYHQNSGWKTTPEIFMYSSNVGIAKMAIEIGKNTQKNYFQKLGLFDPVEVEIPEKSNPIYPQAGKWGNLSTITMSYGHGISLSPLHMVAATIPIVNGGLYQDLSLIKKQNPETSPPPNRIFSASTSLGVNKLLRLAVSRGTGRKADVPGYLVGGKTGTANKASGGKYSKDSRISSFISAFPMHQPRFVVMVMLDEPRGNEKTFRLATAGFTAAPVIAKISRRLGTLYGIEPVDETDPEIKSKLGLEYKIKDDF